MIDILLATFNGEKYLPELLDSIQKCAVDLKVRLIVRDDGSSDRSVAIVEAFAQHSDLSVVILAAPSAARGACSAFSALMSVSSGDYVAFADQDDIWRPEKLQRLLSEIRKREFVLGSSAPLLVHSDLSVVDSNAQEIAQSFWAYQKLDPSADSFGPLLVQNAVTGCAMMVNRALVKLARDIPDKVIMHDWWLALVASAFGEILVVRASLVLYRQHGANSVGAKRWSCGSWIRRAMHSTGRQTTRRALQITQDQCDALLKMHGENMSEEKRAVAQAFVGARSCSWVARRIRFIKHGLLPADIVRRCLWLTWV